MAIQNQTLSGAEHDFFATLSGLPSNAPLTQHKAKVFSDAGFGGIGKPITQMEREWLQNFANSSKLNEGDLWREVVASLGITPSVSTSENKFLFYSSNEALLQGAIRSTAGLVAYYPMNESSGNAINRAPSTLGSLNGTLNGGITQGATGQIGKAYNFNGSTGYVMCKSGAILGGKSIYSIVFIMKTNKAPAASGTCMYVERAAAGNDILKVEYTNDPSHVGELKLDFRDDAGTLIQPLSGVVVNDNNFHMIVVTKSTVLNAYVDGVITAISNTAFTPSNNFTNASIQSRISNDIADSGSWYRDIQQHVALFDGVELTASQALKLAKIAGLA